MPLDARRLVRAGALTLVLFLLVGGGVGFVMAAGESDQLAVPAPRPGDRAVYAAEEVIVDEDLLKLGAGAILLDQVIFEWLPMVEVQARDFSLRPALPLRAEHVFALGEPNENRQVSVIYYDAATRQPLYRAEPDSSRYWHSYFVNVNQVSPTGATVEENWRIDWYNGDIAPCGIVAPWQGRVFEGGAADVAGSCLWPGDNLTTRFVGQGWTNLTDGGRAYAFRVPGHPSLGIWSDNASPFPARVRQTMGEFFAYASHTQGRIWDLQRIEARRGTEEYPAVADTPAGSPVPLVPRTGLVIDDAGLGLPLSLGEAHAAAVAQPAPTAAEPDRQASVGDWLAAHPRGYLAFAARLTHVDREGAANPGWILLWVDGDSWVGKRVIEQTRSAQGLVFLPGALGREVVVQDWTPSWLPDDPGSYFPRIEQLPAEVPSVRDLLDRYAATNPGEAANRYGFEVACRNSPCTDVGVWVEVGSHTAPQTDFVDRYETGVETREELLDKLRVSKDGYIALRTDYLQSETGTFAALRPAGSKPAEGPGAEAVAAAAWVIPSAPAAATGISLLALLGGLVYYFWPALKGAGVGLFSRIQHDDVLSHPMRRRILDAVESEPGIHFLALSRKVDAGRSALEHHLRKLQAAGVVVKRQAPGYTCYFPKGKVDRQLMGAAPSLRSDGSRAILQAVAATPGASSRDLAVRLGLAPSTVSYHLKRLEAAGLVAPGARSGVHLTALGAQAAGPGAGSAGGAAAGAAA